MKSPYKFEKEERGKRRREEKEQESPPGLNPASATDERDKFYKSILLVEILKVL